MCHFYPRSPCGERRQATQAASTPTGFLSTLSLRRATTSTDHHPTSILISIHALLAESDAEMVSRSSISCQFLSTLSLRRATRGEFLKRKVNYHFYPRSPCGERQRSILYTPQEEFISIHALLAESDWSLINNGPGVIYFYPRSPCGERPKFEGINFWQSIISIHALLAESDDDIIALCRAGYTFLSTLSLRRATSGVLGVNAAVVHFYPRSPCGERHLATVDIEVIGGISIHALLAESDTI